jgi:PAS domain-containing protein
VSRLISVASICENLANLARTKGHDSLSMWLKLASNQAYLDNLMTATRFEQPIGVWDWDVANNKNYTNDYAGSFFTIDADMGRRGHPIERIIERIHADDVAHFNSELQDCIATGKAFGLEYRVIVGDTLRWLRADGRCSLDDTGRPMRMLGSLIDITNDKPPQNVVVLRR